MSSTRSRAELAAFEREQQQQRELPAPRRRGSPLTVAAVTASTRERASAAEHQASGEEVLPKLGPRAGARTAQTSINTTVRSRLDKARAEAEARSEQPTRAANAEYWLSVHEEEQQKIADWNAEREREQQERIARRKEIERENALALNLSLVFDQFNATPEERRRILALPGAKDATPEKLVSMLLEVRELHEFNEACCARRTL